MAIDQARLTAQREAVERLRLKAEWAEWTNRLRLAEEEAVRIGLKRPCVKRCGRAVGLKSKGVCVTCQKREWMARKRAEAKRPALRATEGRAA